MHSNSSDECPGRNDGQELASTPSSAGPARCRHEPIARPDNTDSLMQISATHTASLTNFNHGHRSFPAAHARSGPPAHHGPQCRTRSCTAPVRIHTAIFCAPPRARSRHPLRTAHVPLLHRPRAAPVLRLPAHACRLEPPAPRHQLRRAALPAAAAALLHANVASATHRAAPVPALRHASATSPAPTSRFPAEPPLH
jgi:hypothetical protein